MLEALTQGYITPQDILVWVLICILAMIAFNKVYPVIRSKVLKAETVDNMPEQIHKLNGRLDTVEEKLGRDYDSINEIKKELHRQAKENEDSLEERQLLMSSMLAVLDGLQQLGTNGKTKEAKEALQIYLNDQAHKPHHTKEEQYHE